MSYGLAEYAAGLYGGPVVEDPPADDVHPTLAVEVAFTTDALADPAWVDITTDVRSWDVTRGRTRELERFQPGRATIVLGNLERQYDSNHATGPWFGNLKPMRRVRIRETFNGVTYPTFDGFVDRWGLDYPTGGKDATATITATDGFKVLARTDLPRSVYTKEVEADAPVIWWRLDENLARFQEGEALNSGTGGDAMNGTFVNDPRVGGQTLVVNDPGTSMVTQDSVAAPGSPIQGVTIPNADFDLLAQTTFTVEAWVRLGEGGTDTGAIWAVCLSANPDMQAACGYRDPDVDNTGHIQFVMYNSVFSLAYGVMTPDESVVPGAIHHVVAVVESGGQMALYMDGVRYTTLSTGATATSLSGVTRPTGGHLTVAHEDEASNAGKNWQGEITEFAIYTSALSAERVAAHYAAGTTPWQGDDPDDRANRILDVVSWPAGLRELDDGDITFQSATLNTTALEHLQKCSETENQSLLFMDRAGNVRFISEDSVEARLPDAVVFGDDPGEIGYRAITFDDGDSVIRNRVTISRLNGVAQTAEDEASVQEFGRFDYRLDGLLHRFDIESGLYAEQVLIQYFQPRRRVTSLALGPPGPDEAADLFPQMLGRELGDAINVAHRPPGGGDPFEQVCVIEGVSHAGVPKMRTATWVLSPELL